MPAEDRGPMPGASRRSLMLAVAAAPLAAAPAALAAPAVDDAELIALGLQMERLFAAVCAVWEDGRVLRACWEQTQPHRPEALRKRPPGAEVHGWGNSRWVADGDFYGDADVARARQHLADLEAQAVLGSPRALAAACRAREVIRAHEAWRAAWEVAWAVSGIDENWERADRLRDQLRGLRERALQLRARSREALLVKARLVWWDSPFNHDDDPACEEPEWEAFASLLADLQAA